MLRLHKEESCMWARCHVAWGDTRCKLIKCPIGCKTRFAELFFSVRTLKSWSPPSPCKCKSLRVHNGSVMTPEPWLVAAQGYTQTSRHVQSCLFFGCYSSSIFSGGVMSSVLELEKRKASGLSTSVKAKCNDRTGGGRDAPPQPPFKCIFVQA